jgi:ribonuclease H-related protein
MSKKYYAVAKGVKTGIFDTWDECEKMITGHKGATFESFENKEDAEIYLKEVNPTFFTDMYNANKVSIDKSVKKFDDFRNINNISLLDCLAL